MREDRDALVSERARLIELGRWSEADQIVRDAIDPDFPPGPVPPPLALTYLPALASAGENRRPGVMRVAVGNVQVANRGENRDVVVRRAEWVLSGDRRLVDLDCVWPALLTLLYANELRAADAHCHALARNPGWTGSVRHRAALTLLRARIRGLSGDPAGTAELLEALLGDGDAGLLTTLAVAWLIEAFVQLGELDRADSLLHVHGFAGPVREGLRERAELLAARGALWLAAGRFQHSLDDYTECGRALAGWNVTNPAVLCWRSPAALAAVALRKGDLAVALAEDDLAAARKWGSPRAVGVALHAVALARSDEHSLARLEQAAELLDLAHARTELTRTLYDIGILLARRDDRIGWRNRLESAGTVARRSRNPFWARRIDSALRRMVLPPEAGTLTRQELKIAELARAGYSNRKIAETLVLTQRTVEFHLSNVYRKLGISGRRELGSALSTIAF